MTWSVEERKVRVGPLGVRLIDARRDGTSGAGRPSLLLLHGMGAHGDAWVPLIRDLAGVDRVICPDHRGHGHSDWSRDGYWLHDYATDARGLLDQLGVSEVGVAGHSLGARVALVLAPMLGERLRSLALLDGGPELGRSRTVQALGERSSRRHLSRVKSEEMLMAFLREEHPDFAEEQLQIRAHALYRLNWAGMLVPRTDPEVYWLLGPEGLREVEDAWEGLRAVKAPALVVRASASLVLDEKLGRQMVDTLPHGRYQELAVGHSMHYENPALIAETLNAFHASLDP